MSIEVGKSTEHHHTGEIFIAEVDMVIGGTPFHTSTTHEDLYAAIDKVRDESMRMLSEHKKKQKRNFMKGAASIKRFLTENR